MKDYGLIIGLSIAVFVLVILSACFSCSDMVYASVNQLRLKKDAQKGSKRARLALKFAKNYDTTITTVLFSNNLVNIAASSLATVLAYEIFDHADFAPTISSITLLIVLLIFGEILPKVIGRVFSYRLSKVFAYPILWLKTIFFPFIFVTSSLGKLVAKIFIRKDKDEAVISDDELEEMVEKIEEEGIIDEDQSELLKSAIDFKETEAYEVMTPRVDMFAIDIDDDISTWIRNEAVFKHSRIPVYKGSIDNIIGMIPTKQLLRDILAGNQINIKSMIYPVKFVPHSMGISEILKQMKKTKNHIAIVKDEFGGTDGLITMEDILEELVGEMWDEMDKIEEDVHKINRNEYIIEGSMNIEDFFELIEFEGEFETDYETVAGFCQEILDRFAVQGDKFTFADRYDIEILSADEYTVEKIRVVDKDYKEEEDE